MTELTGKSVFEGVAVGKLKIIVHQKVEISDRTDCDPENEKRRFFEGREKTCEYLDSLYRRALAGKVGGAEAEIFSMHKMMAEDLDFEDGVMASIAEGHTAEYAVKKTGEELSAMFASMEDSYMKARAADVADVAGQINRNIMGLSSETVTIEEPCILFAEDFSPSEIVKIDSAKLLGFVTSGGSPNSHTAILARTLGIPAIVATGEGISFECDGHTAVIDCDGGKVFVDLPAAELKKYTFADRVDGSFATRNINYELSNDAGEKCYVYLVGIYNKKGADVVFPTMLNFYEMELFDEMRRLREKGAETAAVLLVTRMDCLAAKFSWDVNPIAAAKIYDEAKNGLNFFCYGCNIDNKSISITKKMKILY